MPRRYRRSRRPRRFRRSRRFKRKSRTTVNLSRFTGPIAPKTILKMKYNDFITSNGAVIDYVYNLNSLYDPDRSGTGHQPYGFDTYASLYHRYRVFKVDWVINASTTNTSTPYTITVLPSNDVGAYTSMTLANENPRAVQKVVNFGNPIKFRGSIYLPRLNGSTSAQYKNDDRFQALNNASPSELMALHLLTSTVSGSAIATIFMDITLTFHCEWFDPLPLAQS